MKWPSFKAVAVRTQLGAQLQFNLTAQQRKHFGGGEGLGRQKHASHGHSNAAVASCGSGSGSGDKSHGGGGLRARSVCAGKLVEHDGGRGALREAWYEFIDSNIET
jgi:hypothetical protein